MPRRKPSSRAQTVTVPDQCVLDRSTGHFQLITNRNAASGPCAITADGSVVIVDSRRGT